jgi:DNA-binding XRE family transcriptional regulator
LHLEESRSARQAARLTQQQAAKRLGVSQPYLALMERGRRPVTARLWPKIVKLCGLGPAPMPLGTDCLDSWDSASLATALASLGYPRFRYLRGGDRNNPAVALLAAVAASDVEVRVVEALPWLLVEYSDLDWDWLIREFKLRDVQNRLGFLVALARQVVDERGDTIVEGRLRQVEKVLNRVRLVREDTLCQASLSDPERRWLRPTRSAHARHWNLLTDLDSETLPYAA